LSLLTRNRQLADQERTTAKDALTSDGRPGRVAVADPAPDDAAGADDPSPERPAALRVARVAAWVVPALTVLLVLFVLLLPNRVGRLSPSTFVRIPVEGLLIVALFLVLPARARRVVAVVTGVGLGLLTVVKIVDMGFYAVLARPFDLVLDWVLLDDAVAFLTDSVGRAGAIGVAVAVVVLAGAVIIGMTLSVLRLSRLVVRHNTVAIRSVAVLGVAWITCAALGVQIVPGVPVAGKNTAALANNRVHQVGAGLLDQRRFAAQATVDAFRDTPGDQLLTALRGKDVIFALVESYGRDAIENPEFASQVGAVLDAGTERLNAAGFASRSGFLTSSTVGSGSWLAHATLATGLWIDNQQRYRTVVTSDRLTLPHAFRRANWETVGVMPGIKRAWPEQEFYGFDRVHDSRHMGYQGPAFAWAPMPDQYTLLAFERLERARQDRGPVMAEIPLVSSHGPWVPIPRLIDWDKVGDGSVFDAMAKEGDPSRVVWSDPTRVRTEYRRSIEYSLNSLISYMATYADDDTVLVFLGDHQPAPLITGEGASRDVPITIVARDPAVLDRISGWGWHEGLKPGPMAPVWRMDAFRDRFLTAFGPQSAPHRAVGSAAPDSVAIPAN
jgi:hypothetical protein